VVWILIFIGYIITIYSTQYWVYGEPYNRWLSAFIYPITRIIWALNTAAIIWMCITGNGGLVHKFLSWKVFIPLSRLTYSVYLTHAWIVWYYWGSRRDLVDLSNFTILTLFCANVLICYILGAFFSLLFESPTFLLQNYLKKSLTHDKRRQNNNYITPPENNDTKDSQIWITQKQIKAKILLKLILYYNHCYCYFLIKTFRLQKYSSDSLLK
jgi:hypothetical protein